MKKILFTFAAFTMLMVSCSQDNTLEIESKGNEIRTYTISATMPGEAPTTRISLETDKETPHGIILKWETSDFLRLCFEHNGKYYYNMASIKDGSISADGLSADFEITVPNEISADESFDLYGVYQKLNYIGTAKFEEGTKNFILDQQEQKGVTLDKEIGYEKNAFKTTPMLYFSQKGIDNTKTPNFANVNLQHSGWMIAIHLRNSASARMFPLSLSLKENSTTPKTKFWNGKHKTQEVKFDFETGTFTSDHISSNWSYQTIEFETEAYHTASNYADSEKIAPKESAIFYRWVATNEFDIASLEPSIRYYPNDEWGGYGIPKTEKASLIPAKTVQKGNVYHIYLDWSKSSFGEYYYLKVVNPY